LENLGLPKGSRVLLLGAGGSARAIALALADAGYTLRLWNRTRERAEQMVDFLGIAGEVIEEPAATSCSLVVNTTSASLAGEALSINWTGYEPGAVAYDLMYGPPAELFLGSAKDAGMRAMDGKELLVAQGARSFEWWTGLQA